MSLCTANLTINPAVGDSGMDAAAYVPLTGGHSAYIVGIKGGRLYKCDATTGSITSTLDFNTRAFGPSCLCYDPVSDSIFCANWEDPTGFTSAGIPGYINVRRSFSKISASSFTVTANFDIASTWAPFAGGLGGDPYITSGIRSLVAANSSVYALLTRDVSTANFIVKFNPTTGALISDINASARPATDIAYENNGGAERIWVTDPANVQLSGFDMTGPALFNQVNTYPGPTFFGSGICYAPSVPALYLCGTDQGTPLASFTIYRYSLVPAFVSSINTGRPSFISNKIRYNSNDGKVYAAGGSDNSVVSFTPGADVPSVSTGFDVPIDFVFTPTLKFAVQAYAGLKAF